MAPLKSDLQYTIRRSSRARRVRVTVETEAGPLLLAIGRHHVEV